MASDTATHSAATTARQAAAGVSEASAVAAMPTSSVICGAWWSMRPAGNCSYSKPLNTTRIMAGSVAWTPASTRPRCTVTAIRPICSASGNTTRARRSLVSTGAKSSNRRIRACHRHVHHTRPVHEQAGRWAEPVLVEVEPALAAEPVAHLHEPHRIVGVEIGAVPPDLDEMGPRHGQAHREAEQNHGERRCYEGS